MADLPQALWLLLQQSGNKQKEHKNVVTFICDTGNKYYFQKANKAWLQDNNLLDLKTYGDLRDLINRRADKGEMISVNETDSLLVVYNRMRASDVSQIPVMKGDKLVGILDEEDLLLLLAKINLLSLIMFLIT